MAKPERINYPFLGEVKAPYVHAVKHDRTLYISGLTAAGSTAQNAGMAEQAEVIFQQLHAIAKAEGTSLTALIKVTIFITSFNEIEALRSVLYRHYGDHLPASSLVEVSRLFAPGLCIETEAIMALPSR